MEIFRKIFGFSNHQSTADDYDRFFTYGENHLDDSINTPSDDNPGKNNFNVFTDPIEMHRYFEQQMDNIFKSFGMPNFGNFFYALQHPDMNDDDDIYNKNGNEDYSKDSRESFLKKGYEKPNYANPIEKIDKDLDGKLSITDLDTLFKTPSHKQTDNSPNQNQSLNIYGGTGPFKGSFFNQSIQVKTIRNPDGSFETHRTVTDSEGNKETTITQKQGDKEYTIVKKQDREGKEEIHETMINMSDDEKSLFAKSDSAASANPFFDNSMFSKFFK